MGSTAIKVVCDTTARIRIKICCIQRGPGGKRIVNVLLGRTELEPQVKSGSWADCTRSK